MLQKYGPLLRVLAVALVLLTGGTVVVTSGDDPAKPTPSPTSPKTQPVTIAEGGENLRQEPFAAQAAKQTRQTRTAVAQRPDARLGPACKVDYSGHVYSDRGGVTPTQFVLHYTVSSNRTGWSDVDAIHNYFKSTMQASSTFIMDFEGHCLKMVPLTGKPWTQLTANPYSYSVEIIATGRESAAEWKAAPIIKKGILAGLVARVLKYEGLPLRQIDPVGCDFSQRGFTDHRHLECGNFHTDVAPHFPFKVFRQQLASLK